MGRNETILGRVVWALTAIAGGPDAACQDCGRAMWAEDDDDNVFSAEAMVATCGHCWRTAQAAFRVTHPDVVHMR